MHINVQNNYDIQYLTMRMSCYMNAPTEPDFLALKHALGVLNMAMYQPSCVYTSAAINTDSVTTVGESLSYFLLSPDFFHPHIHVHSCLHCNIILGELVMPQHPLYISLLVWLHPLRQRFLEKIYPIVSGSCIRVY